MISQILSESIWTNEFSYLTSWVWMWGFPKFFFNFSCLNQEAYSSSIPAMSGWFWVTGFNDCSDEFEWSVRTIALADDSSSILLLLLLYWKTLALPQPGWTIREKTMWAALKGWSTCPEREWRWERMRQFPQIFTVSNWCLWNFFLAELFQNFTLSYICVVS